MCVCECEYWELFSPKRKSVFDTILYIQCSCIAIFRKWSQPNWKYFFGKKTKKPTVDIFCNQLFFWSWFLVKWTRRCTKFNMTDELMKRAARSGGCRLCLAPDSECISIFSLAADKEPIANKIHSCVTIKVSSIFLFRKSDKKWIMGGNFKEIVRHLSTSSFDL